MANRCTCTSIPTTSRNVKSAVEKMYFIVQLYYTPRNDSFLPIRHSVRLSVCQSCFFFCGFCFQRNSFETPQNNLVKFCSYEDNTVYMRIFTGSFLRT